MSSFPRKRLSGNPDRLGRRCASFEASLREAPQDEDSFLILSITYLMLRSAQRAHLEARTALVQLIFSAWIDFLTASKAGTQGFQSLAPGFPRTRGRRV